MIHTKTMNKGPNQKIGPTIKVFAKNGMVFEFFKRGYKIQTIYSSFLNINV